MSSGRYDPDALSLTHGTPYEQAHEWAHIDQQARGTLAWRTRAATLGIPFVERVTNLAVECEAAWLARAEMRVCGIWRSEDRQEATRGLLSYAKSLFSPTVLIFLASFLKTVKRLLINQSNPLPKP